MRVVATKCLLSELVDGDLYSPASQWDWDLILDPPLTHITTVVGHRIFIRSNDLLPDEMARQAVYKLAILDRGTTIGANETSTAQA